MPNMEDDLKDVVQTLFDGSIGGMFMNGMNTAGGWIEDALRQAQRRLTPSAPATTGASDLKMELAKRQMQKEMPAELAGTTIAPWGRLGQLLRPGAEAMAGRLTQTVGYNPAAIQGKGQEEVNDLLAHELTHVRQRNRSGPINYFLETLVDGRLPYYQRPVELEAFQTEKDRALQQRRTPPTTPSFLDGSIGAGDIPLPRR